MPAAPGSVLPDLKRPARGKPGPRMVTVVASRRITPNMIRLTLTGPELTDVRPNCEGANCKIFLPEVGQGREDFARQLKEGPRPVVRTYTVRHWRPEVLELDVDFVDHGTEGPASGFANRAQPGDFCGFAGPGPVKMSEFYADWYLVAADMSALPVAAAALEAMPRDARGVAIFEVTSAEDRQEIDAPEGIEQHWLVHPDPHHPSPAQEEMIRALDWPGGPGADLRRRRERGGQGAARLPAPGTGAGAQGYLCLGLLEDRVGRGRAPAGKTTRECLTGLLWTLWRAAHRVARQRVRQGCEPDFRPLRGASLSGFWAGRSIRPTRGMCISPMRALRRFGLDRLWWLVSPRQPAQGAWPAPIDDRMARARALMHHPRVTVTDIETRLGTRATADTLAALRAAYPGVRFVWLMGADNLAQFHRWQNWETIMETVPLGVLARPGDRISARMSPAAQIYRRFRLPGQASRLLARGAGAGLVFRQRADGGREFLGDPRERRVAERARVTCGVAVPHGR